MPVIAMSRPWLRPHDNKFYLRKRTPARYLEVAGRAEFKIPLNTRAPKEAKTRMPQALATWAEMEAQWERELRKESLTTKRAREIAALWGAWIAGGARLDRAGVSAPKPGQPWDIFTSRVRAHAEEALRLADTTVTEDTLPILLDALSPMVFGAYTEAAARERAVADGRPLAVNTFDLVRSAFPEAQAPRAATQDPKAVTFDTIWLAWSKVTTTAPRTVHGLWRSAAAAKIAYGRFRDVLGV